MIDLVLNSATHWYSWLVDWLIGSSWEVLFCIWSIDWLSEWLIGMVGFWVNSYGDHFGCYNDYSFTSHATLPLQFHSAYSSLSHYRYSTYYTSPNWFYFHVDDAGQSGKHKSSVTRTSSCTVSGFLEQTALLSFSLIPIAFTGIKNSNVVLLVRAAWRPFRRFERVRDIFGFS